MGIEGNIRKSYYSAWNIIVDQEINFDKRVIHPPDNMINSLISFVNSLIYSKVLSEIYKTQLNPTISYLHEPGVRRFSLCLVETPHRGVSAPRDAKRGARAVRIRSFTAP